MRTSLSFKENQNVKDTYSSNEEETVQIYGTIMRGGNQNIFVLTGYIDARRDRRKHRVTYLTSLYKLIAEQGALF